MRITSVRILPFVSKVLGFSLFLLTETMAQMPTRPVDRVAPAVEEDYTWWYLTLLVLALALGGAVAWWYKTKFAKPKADVVIPESEDYDPDSLDADAELAWLKRISKKKSKQGELPSGMPRASRALKKNGLGSLEGEKGAGFEETKKKIKQAQFEKLPVNGFTGLNPTKPFDALPVMNDDALLSAIEQTQCEDEEDPEIRELAIRILARFRSRNAVEALSQVAMYDISSSLRSKAVLVLAEFDHESVFESILLCCADPTREVRAAAARALFNLNFDRADAWARIAECGDDFRMIQAARAAIESDLVKRSIERLTHEDIKHAYEAFALVALLIRAGETDEIFEVLESHADQFVKLGLIRVFRVFEDERVTARLVSYMERNTLPENIGKAVNDCIKNARLVPA
ncbi:MAG: HEAT repeat domain-containing protein [Pyrinomonadaceae bacterium]